MSASYPTRRDSARTALTAFLFDTDVIELRAVPSVAPAGKPNLQAELLSTDFAGGAVTEDGRRPASGIPSARFGLSRKTRDQESVDVTPALAMNEIRSHFCRRFSLKPLTSAKRSLRLALATLAFVTSAFAESAYAPRLNFGARLEPIDRILHGAGQDVSGYTTYAGLLPTHSRPALYMTYIGMTVTVEGIEDWARRTREELASIRDHRPILQIGLWLTGDGKPQDDKVAAGAHDAQIEAFARVLKELNRPALVRIGYEFEGAWNGYRPETFKASWKKIASALRARNLPVALVWCAAGPAAGWTDLKTPLDFYPGDEWVDWWGIDLFDPHDIHDARTYAFLDRARAHRKPVLIGESSPKGVGVLEGEASWKKWYAPYFQLLRERPEIKGFCYINWEWSFWAKKYGFNWDDWGDCRIEKNAKVRKRWQAELRAPVFQHGLISE